MQKERKKTFETRHDTSCCGGVQGDALRRARRRGAGSLQSFVRADRLGRLRRTTATIFIKKHVGVTRLSMCICTCVIMQQRNINKIITPGANKGRALRTHPLFPNPSNNPTRRARIAGSALPLSGGGLLLSQNIQSKNEFLSPPLRILSHLLTALELVYLFQNRPRSLIGLSWPPHRTPPICLSVRLIGCPPPPFVRTLLDHLDFKKKFLI